MASSTIEVMGGSDLDDVSLFTPGETETTSDSSQDGQALKKELPSSTSRAKSPSIGMDDSELLGLNEIPPPEDFFYSPQDMSAFPKMPKKAKNKTKKQILHRKADSFLLGAMDDIDYHKIDRPTSCDICGKVFSNGKFLLQHMSTHSEMKKFTCSYCPKTFTRLVHLKGHLTTHGIEKQFQCPICLQRFTRHDCVKVHMRIHDKSKCVFCDVCHKAFLTVGALSIHERIHRGEKPFKCHLCGKCFTQKNHVITHIKRHTKISDDRFSKKLGPRMFKCEHCPRSFIRLSDYERHVQWNHGAIADQQVLSNLSSSHNEYNYDENIGELNQDISIEEIIPKTKKPRYRAPKKVRSCSTQTSEEGGHIIIPRKYQNIQNTTTTGTQVSAPPTPRAPDDEIYESDMFDEGMDRNFSSDEEELGGQPRQDNTESILQQTSTLETTSRSTLSDEIFDAVLKNLKGEPEKNEDNTQASNNQDMVSKNQEPDNENTLSKSPIMSGNDSLEPNSAIMSGDDSPIKTKENSPMLAPQKSFLMASSKAPSISPSKQSDKEKSKETQKTFDAKFMGSFNMANWKGKHSRGRGRPKLKKVVGFTGATHLSLIRRSMLNCMAEGKTESKKEKIEPKKEKVESEAVQESLENRSKRKAKKEHGKDFICSSKSCMLCNVEKKLPIKKSISPAKIESQPTSDPLEIVQNEEPEKNDSTPSKQLLKFLVSGDTTALQGTNFKLLNEDDEDKNVVGLLDMTSQKAPVKLPEVTKLVPYDKKPSKPSKASDIISPPVELQSFCIPTFSCKLCGREFRFEGKLHRHIESVHQKKAIFSPDVRPGKGANNTKRILDTNDSLTQFITTPSSIKSKAGLPQKMKKAIPKNPEIEALRSEWDDEDDDVEEMTMKKENEERDHYGMNEDDYNENDEMDDDDDDYEVEQEAGISFVSSQVSGVNRSFVPMKNTLNDVFKGGVKVNLNKLTGLVPGTPAEKISKPSTNQPETKVISGFDAKCHKLLEKLFDSSLLLSCGISSDHISAVLGKVLQHYGVKMIEDYGQGQYEVLKYNLWRLIEWKVTMEQMEEFYTEGKSVEEMMDDIMLGKVPIIAHHEPKAAKEDSIDVPVQDSKQISIPSENVDSANQVQNLDTLQLGDNQIVLSQLSSVLTGHLNLGEGITQVVLAQDVSPELLQGAQIVTIDPSTGQVLSQVTADQVILSATDGQNFNQPSQSVAEQAVSSSSATTTVVSALPPGSIVADSQQVFEQALQKDPLLQEK